MWAEEFGLGELGLQPADFWALTVREFWLKHAAFARAEDRARALMLEHVLLTSPRSNQTQTNVLRRNVNALRRYPVQRWLK